MSHHNSERIEEIKATRKRLKKSISQEAHDKNIKFPPQKRQWGNINEFNELTLALVNPGALITKAGFDLSKSAAKGGLRLIRNVINKGKKALNTRAGKLAQKHADDILMVNSLGKQTK